MVDQRLIQKTEVGSWALHDILECNDAEHARSQGLIGKSLVQQFMDIHVPKAVASTWSDVPGAIAALVQRIHLQEGLLRTRRASWRSSTSTHLMHGTP